MHNWTEKEREALELWLSKGLVGWQGNEHQRCLLSAVRAAIYGADTISDTVPCAHGELRSAGITLNDHWANPETRSQGLRQLAYQLPGTKDLSDAGIAHVRQAAQIKALRLAHQGARAVLSRLYKNAPDLDQSIAEEVAELRSMLLRADCADAAEWVVLLQTVLIRAERIFNRQRAFLSLDHPSYAAVYGARYDVHSLLVRVNDLSMAGQYNHTRHRILDSAVLLAVSAQSVTDETGQDTSLLTAFADALAQAISRAAFVEALVL